MVIWKISCENTLTKPCQILVKPLFGLGVKMVNNSLNTLMDLQTAFIL